MQRVYNRLALVGDAIHSLLIAAAHMPERRIAVRHEDEEFPGGYVKRGGLRTEPHTITLGPQEVFNESGRLPQTIDPESPAECVRSNHDLNRVRSHGQTVCVPGARALSSIHMRSRQTICVPVHCEQEE